MIHIFDVDHTLYQGSTVMDYLHHSIARGTLPPGLLRRIPGLTFLFLAGRGNEAVTGKDFPFLKGLRKEDLRKAAEELFSARMVWRLNIPLLDMIASLKERGETVILASSSFAFLLEPLSAHLSADHLIATELEYDGDLTTGRLSGVPAFGGGKLDRIASFLSGAGKEGLGSCSFYTDSHRDLPLLEAVGFPVAVNPDRRLGRIAKKRKWEIVRSSFRKSAQEGLPC